MNYFLFSQLLRNKMALILLGFSMLMLTTNKIYSQKAADSSKMSVKMKLNYKKSNDIKSVKVLITRKENKETIPVSGVIVNLYLNEVKKCNPRNGTGWITNLVTDDEGEGTFEFYDSFNKVTAGMHEFNFIARMFNDPRYEDTQAELVIKDAKITLTFSKEDSINKVTAKLVEIKDSAAEVAVPETEIKLGIKRTFSMMPMGEGGQSTDSKGEATAELPFDVPVDASGRLTVVARVEDNENYGTVETSQDIAWNVPQKIEASDQRSLWSSGRNAPLSLVFLVVSMIIVVWGVIIYLIFQLFKIRKIGRKNSSEENPLLNKQSIKPIKQEEVI